MEKYEAFFLLTNDTELYPCETIKNLIDTLDQHPKVGIFSGLKGLGWDKVVKRNRNKIFLVY